MAWLVLGQLVGIAVGTQAVFPELDLKFYDIKDFCAGLFEVTKSHISDETLNHIAARLSHLALILFYAPPGSSHWRIRGRWPNVNCKPI